MCSSNQLKMTINCLLICASIAIVSGQNQQHQQYKTYNNPHARQQLVYQYDTPPQKTPPYQYVASAPAPFPSATSSFHAAQAPLPHFQAQIQAPNNLNARENQALIRQIVQGSERFTFEMIYVSSATAKSKKINKQNSFCKMFSSPRLLRMRSRVMI